MIYYLLALLGIAIGANTFCMERPCLPKEVIEYIGTWKDTSITQYQLGLESIQAVCALPWTISPTLVKYCTTNTPLETDLSNPEPNEKVLPNAQLWRSRVRDYLDNGGDTYGVSECSLRKDYRLSEDFRRTNDFFAIKKEQQKLSTWFFDGINALSHAVLCHKYNGDSHNQEYYNIFVLTQGPMRGKEYYYEEMESIREEGLLRSLMLEYHRNRIIYSVHATKEECYKLCIDDISIENRVPIATCMTDKLFVKTVPLGKDTYFGITEEGLLYSIWLNDKADICCARQIFSSNAMRFKDISVDHSVVTAHGFYPKVAFLTKTGEMFVTDLGGFKQPTLLYVRKIDSIDNVKRCFYNQGKLLIFNDAYEVVHEYKDNFDILYCCALLKHLLPIDRG